MIFAASQFMREGLEFATRNGVDPKAVVNMLTTTLFASPIYQSYGQRLAAGTFTSSLSLIPVKDIGLFKTSATEFDMPTPIADVLQVHLRKDAGLV